MNTITALLNQVASVLQVIFLFVAMIGGIYMLRGQKRAGIVKIQSDTIEAMQSQIDALKAQNAQQQQKLDRQEFELKAMRDALRDEGILITIDGERVTIKDTREPDTTRHIIRKSPAKKTPATAPKASELP